MTRVDAPVLETIPDITGEFLFAISPGVAPDGRLQFLATVELTPTGDSAATVDISLAPLDRDSRRIVPDSEPLTDTDVPVDAAGQFVAQLNGPIPGRANELSGSDLMVEAEVTAVIRDEDLFCGGISGMETNLNISLDGSLFAANRVPEGTIGNDLPDPLVDCPDPTADVDAGVPDAMPVPDAGASDAGVPDDGAPPSDSRDKDPQT